MMLINDHKQLLHFHSDQFLNCDRCTTIDVILGTYGRIKHLLRRYKQLDIARVKLIASISKYADIIPSSSDISTALKDFDLAFGTKSHLDRAGLSLICSDKASLLCVPTGSRKNERKTSYTDRKISDDTLIAGSTLTYFT